MDKSERLKGNYCVKNYVLFACKQKLNNGIAANSDYFAVNRMSKYASVLYNPVVYSE